MRLLLHQFRKDFQQTWIVWALWFFFVLVQFGLAAWTVNPADLGGAGLYGQILGMVPAIHAILVFVLIPLLVFQEPPVGTTASWLTRPMPAVTVLGSKLISFGILVLLPLIGQCLVLSAHHIVFADVVLAGLEIALKELSWIALATGLAVLCPNFATFLVAAVALYILQYFSGWLWSWVDLLHPAAVLPGPDGAPFLAQSRLVASDLLCIVFGLGVVFFQYLTRRTRRAIAAGILGLILAGAVARYWPWDFISALTAKPDTASLTFDASKLHFLPGPSHGLSEDGFPGTARPTKTFNMQFAVPDLPPEENLSVVSEGGEQRFPDGSKLTLQPANPGAGSNMPRGIVFFNRFQNYGLNFAAIDASIGYLPILNQQFNGNFYVEVQDLFTLGSDVFAKKGADLGAADFHLAGQVSGVRFAAEIPLQRGAVFSHLSKRTTLTAILKRNDGVDLVLRERSLSLLLAPGNPEEPEGQPVYLLVNRKRSEALAADSAPEMPDADTSNLGGLMSAFNLGDSRFEVFSTLNLSFHAPQVPDRPLPVPIDDAWVADAVLVRIDPASHGSFKARVHLNDFALDGHTLPDGNLALAAGPDLDALQKIVLPANATRADVWHYITQILYLSSRQRNFANGDPQVDLLAQVGPKHATDLLIAATTFPNFNYPHLALKTLDLSRQDDARQMIFRLLPTHTDLIDLIVPNHWETLVKGVLLARVRNLGPGERIDDAWLDVLAVSHDDPAVKQAFLDLLPVQPDVIRFITANHWEADAKPILIAAIARSRPGSQVDARWIQVLDSFHDDSRVKALLLRVLPSNQGAIESVVENHWEADAKPIMLKTLNNAKKGDNIDPRWFNVLASLADESGVKEAILRVLPFCHGAIDTVIVKHWEADAQPILLATLARANPGDTFDDRWFQALDTPPSQSGIEETVLRVLPFVPNAIISVTFHHWENDAKPIVLSVLEQAKPGANYDGRWFDMLNSLADKRGVKEALLHILPFIPYASSAVIHNHWENDARPIVLARLANAKFEDRFDNQFIGLAASDPPTAEFKSALFHILPSNDGAIDFVVQNHWEADAETLLLRKMAMSELGQDVSPSWIKALASVQDTSTYPLLLAYAESRLNRFFDDSILESLRPLPGALVSGLVARQWILIRGTESEGQALFPVATWGVADALDRSTEILLQPQETDPQKIGHQNYLKEMARNVLRQTTPCPDGLLDTDLVGWYEAHKATLAFDPSLARYVPNPQTLPATQSWPRADDTMRGIGHRISGGDASAFDELEATLDRAIGGLDPVRDAGKIRDIRGGLANGAFDVLRNDVAKNPAILALLDTANRRADLRPLIVSVYARAAEEGNEQALDALLQYPSHQWSLVDVVGNLRGTVAKQNGKAIDFEENLLRDPNSTPQIIAIAEEELLTPANAGSDQAQAAYRALRQRSP